MSDYKAKKYLFHRDCPLKVAKLRSIGGITVYQIDELTIQCFNDNNSIQFDCWDSNTPEIVEKFKMFSCRLFAADYLDWGLLFRYARILGISSRGCNRPKLDGKSFIEVVR